MPVYTGIPTMTGNNAVDIECHYNDDALEAVMTGAENCELVDKKNGFYQFKYLPYISCTNPTDFAVLSGATDCMYREGAWVAR